jgi:hypothetical protein
VSGPSGTGRTQLVKSLLQLDQSSPSSKTAVIAAPVTTTRRKDEENEEGNAQTSFVCLDRSEFEKKQRDGSVIAMYPQSEEEDGDDDACQLSGLCLDDVLKAGSEGRVCVIDAPSTQFADRVALALENRSVVVSHSFFLSFFLSFSHTPTLTCGTTNA